MSKNRKPKVILIGLDGATWNLIKPWVEEGRLPAFKKIIRSGSVGGFQSSIPPSSPIAWTSIFTGRNPGKHSIFSFVKPKEGTYFIRPISSRDVKCETLWEFLTQHGRRGIYLNIPFSYPIEGKINGIITSGLGTPSIKSKFCCPENIKEEILRKFPDYNVDFEEDLILGSENRQFIIPKIREVTNGHIGLSKYLFKREKWDLFAVVLRSLDVIQHYYWNDKEIILQYYQQADEFLGWLLKNMDENTTLFICSDHGFNYSDTKVYINNWLEKNYLLKLKKRTDWTSTSLVSAELIQKYLMKLGLRNFVWWAKRSKLLEPILKYLVPSKHFRHIYQIDWQNTKAYFLMGSAGIININLKGREPQGIVENEYDEIRNYILEMAPKLRRSRIPQKPIKQAYLRETIYHGDQDIPDIFLLKNPGFTLAGGYNNSGNIFEREVNRIGDHEETGVLLAYGKGIKPSKIEGARTYDLVPTILHILKLPIPHDMDGKFLKDIF